MYNNNDSQRERLITYLKVFNKEITVEELKFILGYLRELRIAANEVDPEISRETIIQDMVELKEKLRDGDLTPLSRKRLESLLDLSERLLAGEDINQISSRLDILYYLNDMDVRKHSNLSLYKTKQNESNEEEEKRNNTR